MHTNTSASEVKMKNLAKNLSSVLQKPLISLSNSGIFIYDPFTISFSSPNPLLPLSKLPRKSLSPVKTAKRTFSDNWNTKKLIKVYQMRYGKSVQSTRTLRSPTRPH